MTVKAAPPIDLPPAPLIYKLGTARPDPRSHLMPFSITHANHRFPSNAVNVARGMVRKSFVYAFHRLNLREIGKLRILQDGVVVIITLIIIIIAGELTVCRIVDVYLRNTFIICIIRVNAETNRVVKISRWSE